METKMNKDTNRKKQEENKKRNIVLMSCIRKAKAFSSYASLRSLFRAPRPQKQETGIGTAVKIGTD